MRKLGFILPLVTAAAMVFGAEPEKKASAEEKKAEVKAPEKKAEAPAKVEEVDPNAPIDTPIPWFVPAKAKELKSGMKFTVPPEGIRIKANMAVGHARSFLLKANAGGVWIINAVNAKVAAVRQIDSKKDWATFEIVAIHTGRTLLEMTQVDDRNAPLRAFRCYIEVK